MLTIMRRFIIATTIIAVLVLLVLGITLFWQTPKQSSTLSDEALLAYAKAPFDKQAMMFKDFILGNYHGTPVRVSFPCSDVCPDYTIRIIQYDVPVAECASHGGVVQSINVPVAIMTLPKDFCIPKILIDNKL